MALRVLIGGETSRTIASAFEARGHYVLTADFRPCQRGGNHYQGPWEHVQGDGWDLAIFHRTCTNMANSGAKHLYRNMKKENGIDEGRFIDCLRDAWDFWNHRNKCPVRFAAWENPVMLPYAQSIIGKPSQVVQPWWFGDDPDGPDNVKKATCWWLNELPKLKPTGSLDGSTARDEVFRMAPTKDPNERRMARSVFTPGHAAAIADLWGPWVANQLANRAA
ncbi:MAG: hypothetical protein AAFR21_14970 [Pseudomonadota bacterium]